MLGNQSSNLKHWFSHFRKKEKIKISEKERIAEYAASLVDPEEMIILNLK